MPFVSEVGDPGIPPKWRFEVEKLGSHSSDPEVYWVYEDATIQRTGFFCGHMGHPQLQQIIIMNIFNLLSYNFWDVPHFWDLYGLV